MGIVSYKKYAMHSKADFELVFSNGKHRSSRCFKIVYILRPEMNSPKISVCSYKKSGNAVVRNRLKRITKEILDELAVFFRPGLFCILPQPGLLQSDHPGRKNDFIQLMNRYNLFQDGAV